MNFYLRISSYVLRFTKYIITITYYFFKCINNTDGYFVNDYIFRIGCSREWEHLGARPTFKEAMYPHRAPYVCKPKNCVTASREKQFCFSFYVNRVHWYGFWKIRAFYKLTNEINFQNNIHIWLLMFIIFGIIL